MTFSSWGDGSPFPTIAFRWVFRPLKRSVPPDPGIVTAYTDGVVTLRANKRIDGYHEAADLSTYQGVEQGDFVVHGLDILRGSVGVSDSAGAMSPVCTVLRAEDGHDPRYHGYLIRAQAASGFTRALARGIREGGADFRRWDTLASLPLLAPPLDIQRRIADMLDAETARIDALIEKNQTAQRLVGRRLEASVSHSMVFLESPAIGVGYLAAVVTSGIDKHIVEGERPVRLCNYTDIYYGTRIDADADFMLGSCTEQEFSRLQLRPGDVVATKDSETADDIGRPAIIVADLPDLVLGYHNALFRVQDPALEPEFLYWFLRSTAARDYFALKARGVTRVGLRAEDLAALRIPLPSLADQRAIAGRLWREQDAVRSLNQKMQRQIELLRLRRQSLITAAVTGQIEV